VHRSKESIQGGCCFIVASDHTATTLGIRDDQLLSQSHNRLAEIVVGSHQVVAFVEGMGLVDSIQALIAQVLGYEGSILLLHETVVILVPGARAGEFDAWEALGPESQHVVKNSLPLSGWRCFTGKGSRWEM